MRENDQNKLTGLPTDLQGGALLRAGADGELDSGSRARLDRAIEGNPDDAARVAFERQLRSACGRVMGVDGAGAKADELGDAACPEALRQKVLAIAAESRAEDARLGEQLDERSAETRDQSYWAEAGGSASSGGRSRFAAWMLGVAAVAALAVTLTMVVRTPGPSGGAGAGAVEYVAFRDKVTRFVAGEHDRCWDSPRAADAKFVMTDPEEVRNDLRDLLEQTVDLPAWHQPTEALVFRGSGRCGVPSSGGKSHHMRFDVTDEQGEITTSVSLFVAPDAGKLPLEEGITYAVDTKACGAEGSSVLVWSASGLVFYLVAEEGAGACEKLRKAMSVPEPTGNL